MTAKQSEASASAQFVGGLIGALAGTAVTSWLGGLALHVGFGVSVPFIAAWLLLIGFLFFAKTLALTVYRAKADVELELMAKYAAAAAKGDARTLLDMDKKIKDTSNNSGAYL